MSQIVTINARAKSHSLCVADFSSSTQTVDMTDTGDKNGGPNHLRAWRDFKKLSQAELAERVKTNANMIGYLESGERGLSAKWLRKLAPALETTPGMLLDHDPRTIDKDILELWSQANLREKKQISEIAKALLATGTNG